MESDEAFNFLGVFLAESSLSHLASGREPHAAPPSLAQRSDDCIALMTGIVRVLTNLGLDALPADELSRAVRRLGTMGHTFRGKDGSLQYLVELQDPLVYDAYKRAAAELPGMSALREIGLAICTSGAVRSAPAAADAEAGDADERHLWIRIAAGRGFSTNSGCEGWHRDNPGRPSRHATGRLMVKLYSASSSCPHLLELRGSSSGDDQVYQVQPGDAVWMDDVARGSSEAAFRIAPQLEHRGRTPEGWTLELVLTCVLDDEVELERALRKLGSSFAERAAQGCGGPTLRAGAPIMVDPAAFVPLERLAGGVQEAAMNYASNAYAAATTIPRDGSCQHPVVIAVPVENAS